MKKFYQSLGSNGGGEQPVKKKFYILRGQSNTDGRGQVVNLPPNLQGPIPNSLVWWNDEWQPLEAGANASLTLEVGFIINLAYVLNQSEPDVTHYFNIYAVGGTNIDYWSYPSGQGYLDGISSYQSAFLSMTDFEVQGFYWLQGESDGLTEPLANSYQAKEVQLINDYKREYNSQAPWYTANIGDVTAGGIPFANTVRQAKINNNSAMVYEGYFDTFDLALLPDGQHFTTDSQTTIGQRFFNLI